VPAIYVEGGGGGPLRRGDLDAYVRGVLDVLAAFEVIDPHRATGAVAEPQFIDEGDGDVDNMPTAIQRGFCITNVAAGDRVRQGELVAEIRDSDGRSMQTVQADRDALVMMIRSTARIDAGEGIAMLAAVHR
jgi:predicted deacylase